MGKVRGNEKKYTKKGLMVVSWEGTKPFEGVKIKMTKALFYNRAHGG